MFAVKRKEPGYAAFAEQRRLEEQRRLAAAYVTSQPAAPEPIRRANRPEKLYLASEIISEEPKPVPVAQPREKVYCESVIIEEPVLVPVEEADTTEELKPVGKYGRLEPIETLDDELVADKDIPLLSESAEKPAGTPKLAKLPGLIDLILTKNLSKSVRMNFAMLLLKQYNKYKNFPEEKAILIECLKKLIASLSKG